METIQKSNRKRNYLRNGDVNGSGNIGTTTITLNTSSSETTTVNINTSGAVSNVMDKNLASNRAVISDYTGKIAASSVKTSELNTLTGARSNIQSQIDDLKITGAATSIKNDNLDGNMVLVSDDDGKVAEGTISTTELNYLSGATANIQSQIDDIKTSGGGGAIVVNNDPTIDLAGTNETVGTVNGVNLTVTSPTLTVTNNEPNITQDTRGIVTIGSVNGTDLTVNLYPNRKYIYVQKTKLTCIASSTTTIITNATSGSGIQNSWHIVGTTGFGSVSDDCIIHWDVDIYTYALDASDCSSDIRYTKFIVADKCLTSDGLFKYPDCLYLEQTTASADNIPYAFKDREDIKHISFLTKGVPSRMYMAKVGSVATTYADVTIYAHTV